MLELRLIDLKKNLEEKRNIMKKILILLYHNSEGGIYKIISSNIIR